MHIPSSPGGTHMPYTKHCIRNSKGGNGLGLGSCKEGLHFSSQEAKKPPSQSVVGTLDPASLKP